MFNIYLSFMWKVEHASDLKMSFARGFILISVVLFMYPFNMLLQLHFLVCYLSFNFL